MLRKRLDHGVHLLKLLQGGLDVRVELFVLGVLVVEHGPVPVLLLAGPDRWIFTAQTRENGSHHSMMLPPPCFTVEMLFISL